MALVTGDLGVTLTLTLGLPSAEKPQLNVGSGRQGSRCGGCNAELQVSRPSPSCCLLAVGFSGPSFFTCKWKMGCSHVFRQCLGAVLGHQ